MAHDVFISYSSKDKPIADGICANLEAAGVRCWIAPRDIAPGEEWPRAITNAISNSQVMILVFSAASNSSSDVGREIVLAANHNLVIIPFKIENIEPEPGKQYYLAQTHWLEAMNPPTRDQIQKLVDRVKAIVPPLDSTAAGQPTPVPVVINEQPIKTNPILKRSPFRPVYGWIVGALAVIILGMFLWPKMQGMLSKTEVTQTLAFTDIPLPSTTVTISPTFTPTLTSIPTARATPTKGIGSTTTRPKDGMVMVYVPAGEFKMGDNYGDTDEQPAHPVTLDAFWIDQTEVTNAMWAKCVQAGNCGEPVRNSSSNRTNYYGNPEYDNFPVINVNPNSSIEYCRWAGARLPTEAEWEKAARGTDGRTYPWGNDSPNENLLNYNMNIKDTTAVGSYPDGASPYGALDMAGNVYEWVADFYSETYYSISPSSNPAGPASGSYRILRGGAASTYETGVRSASRLKLGNETSFTGFRCARD